MACGSSVLAKRRALDSTTGPLPIDKTMAAVLGVLIAERDERISPPVNPRKTELILADAGLAIGDIALLTGKKYSAVQMAISRAKSRTKPVGPKRTAKRSKG
jgi:hypothetical protein